MKRRLSAARTWVVLGLSMLGSSLLVSSTSCVWGLEQESRYADYAEAQQAAQRGWLPTLLPRSAREIHEWHDLDTNLQLGSFRFDPKERSSIEVRLRPGARRTIRIDRDPSFASVLPRDPNEQQLTTAGFQLYSDDGFDFAIDWNAGVAYFWTASS